MTQKNMSKNTTCSKTGELTNKQEAFCREYIIDFNATQAAIRAGYSEKASTAIGHENLTKPYLMERINVLKAELAKKNEISAERVLKEIHKTAFFNVKDAMEWDGGILKLKRFEELPDHVTANISSIKQDKDGNIEVKFYDKQKATEQLARYFELYKAEIQNENAVTIMNIYPSPKKKAVGLLSEDMGGILKKDENGDKA